MNTRLVKSTPHVFQSCRTMFLQTLQQYQVDDRWPSRPRKGANRRREMLGSVLSVWTRAVLYDQHDADLFLCRTRAAKIYQGILEAQTRPPGNLETRQCATVLPREMSAHWVLDDLAGHLFSNTRLITSGHQLLGGGQSPAPNAQLCLGCSDPYEHLQPTPMCTRLSAEGERPRS